MTWPSWLAGVLLSWGSRHPGFAIIGSSLVWHDRDSGAWAVRGLVGVCAFEFGALV